MGLLSVIRKQRLRELELRFLLLGLDNAGKTSLLRRLCAEDPTTAEPTFGFNIRTLLHHDSQLKRTYSLNLWDVGGQKSLRSYWRNYFENTDALIWVVDSADPLRLADCRKELHALLLEETRSVKLSLRGDAQLT